ncbi:MAG: hypothetical protein HUU35_07940 [Armatimonadetes bacterium]|nr:hypothetical protein [Armatimonadota bacterium]
MAAEGAANDLVLLRELGRSLLRRENSVAMVTGTFVHRTSCSEEGYARQVALQAKVIPEAAAPANRKTLFVGRFSAGEGWLEYDLLTVVGGHSRLGSPHRRHAVASDGSGVLGYLADTAGHPLISLVADGEQETLIDHARRAARVTAQEEWPAALRHRLVSNVLITGPAPGLSWAELLLHYAGDRPLPIAPGGRVTVSIQRSVASESGPIIRVAVTSYATDGNSIHRQVFDLAPGLDYAVVRVEEYRWQAKPASAWMTVYQAHEFAPRAPAVMPLPSRTSVSRYYYPEGRPGYWGSSEETVFTSLDAWSEAPSEAPQTLIPFGYLVTNEVQMKRSLGGGLDLGALESEWEHLRTAPEPSLVNMPERP